MTPGAQPRRVEIVEVGVEPEDRGVLMVLSDMLFPAYGHGHIAERSVYDEARDRIADPHVTEEHTVRGEVARLLEMAELGRDDHGDRAEGCRARGSSPGPPCGDLQPMSRQKQCGREIVRPGPLLLQQGGY